MLHEYLGPDGKPVTSVKVGDELTVRVRLRAVDRPFVSSVAIVDLLPGGFEVVLTPGGAESKSSAGTGVTRRLASGGTWNAINVDVREDRVLLYGVALRELHEYTYRIRATNVGRFVAPPAYAEALYEPLVRARSLPSRITVERPSR
ncbi:MAG: hypothetical protein DMD81_21365 [Candidatus Rokuibacteriota bacterium]|nr:MAG: hypothetical protein DMD81_21365 [Candidatus Rokubacteria bacterium]